MSNVIYRLHPRVAFRQIKGSTYILPVRSDRSIYILKGWAQVLWKYLVESYAISEEDLLNFVSSNAVITNDRMKSDVVSFFRKLVAEGLLISIDAPTSSVNPPRPTNYDILWKIADQHAIPLKVDIELTYKCNLRCKYCYIDGEQTSFELPTRRLITLLDELADMGCLFLAFTGGEPFLREDLLEVLGEANKRWFSIRLLTNGTLINEQAVRVLSKISRLTVEISIHGSTPTRHDAFTQKQGAFNAMKQAIKLLREADIPTLLKLTITRLNVDDIPHIRSFAEKLGVPVLMSPLVFPSIAGKKKIENYRVNDEQLTKLMKQGDYVPSAFQCSSGRAKAWISPNGNVYPCEFIRIPMGNIMESNFSSIWNNRKIKLFRENIRSAVPQNCQRCVHSTYCPRCPGIAWLEQRRLDIPPSEACRISNMWASLNDSTFSFPGRKKSIGKEE